MDEAFLEKQKNKLLAEKMEILKSEKGKNEQLANLLSSPESGDDADIASDTIDKSLLTSLNEANRRRLSLIDRALTRIKDGTYGLCMICKKPIPEARLEALPSALLCVSCQEKEEKRNR